MRRTIIIVFFLGVIVCITLALLRPPIVISMIGGWRNSTCRYEHVETTGLMDTVDLPNGTSAIIQFTADSDSTAVAALDHMCQHMIFGTSDDKRTVGSSPFRQNITLHGEIAKVRSNGLLYGDGFYWFRLTGWTLELPFDMQVSDMRDFDSSPQIQSFTTLAEAGVQDLIISGKRVSLEPFLTTKQNLANKSEMATLRKPSD